jgi:hypothetical protein
MSSRFLAVLCGLIVVAGGSLVAQSGSIRLSPMGLNAPHFAERWRPAASKGGQSKIVGTVIDIRQVPVAKVRVQLRNLTNGTVQEQEETNGNGEYEFAVDDSGTYVVEMIMVDGSVVGLSNAGSIGRFETLQTVVQLPGRWEGAARGMVMPYSASSFVGMSAATTMTAQTVAIALEQSIQPVDAGVPVSPFKP